MLDKLEKYMLICCVGGIGYGVIEVTFRGYSHWSMVITGGICFLLLTGISQMGESRPRQWIMGACVITAVEFVVGCVVNLRMGLNVWDYSDEPVHLLGQICPRFSLIWLILCIPAIAFAQRLYTALTQKEE